MKHVLRKSWIILILFGILWGMGIYYGHQVEQDKNQVSIRINSKSEDRFTVEELKTLYEAEKSTRITGVPEITGFEEMGRTEVLEPATGRRISTDYVLVWGNKSNVYERWLVYGSYGIGTPDECIITTKAARELFQSEDVAGLTLVWNNKEWVIRGVIDYKRTVILFTAREQDYISNLELFFHEGNQTGLETQNMLYRNGLDKEIVIIDHSLFGAICRLFYMLPCFYLLWMGLRIVKSRTKKRGMVVLEIVIFTLLFFLLASQVFRFPVTFIPSKWSDFDFWVDRWKEISLNVKEIKALTPFDKDILFRKKVVISISFSLIAGLGIVFYGKPMDRQMLTTS